jgi:hypothetical protein
MSLINDALRRAQAAQPQPPPPPLAPVPPRPLEPVRHARHNLGLMVPVSLAILALFALLFVWQWAQRARNATELQEARALTAPIATASIAPQPASPMLAMTPPPAQPTSMPQPQTLPAPVADGPNNPAAAAPTNQPGPSLAQDQKSDRTNAAVIVPPAPKPAPLRLQAIVFNPKRPSALINGKTLFVGDKLGDARVVGIGQNSATLVRAGKTTVLILPE